MVRISDRTSIAMPVAISFTTGMVGFTFWISTVYAKVETISSNMDEVQKVQLDQEVLFRDIHGKIEKLDAKVQYIYDAVLRDEEQRLKEGR